MRGDIVYRVYGLHEGREKDHFFGAFRSRSEADAEIAKLYAMGMDGRNWAKQYHNKGFVVRETLGAVDFEIPSQPKPRDNYAVKGSPKHKVDRKSAPPPFIKVSKYKGVTQVSFAVEMMFDLESGGPPEWQRLKISSFE
jgi:hypothetical protein